jgi:hypothetical protein
MERLCSTLDIAGHIRRDVKAKSINPAVDLLGLSSIAKIGRKFTLLTRARAPSPFVVK